MADSYDVVIAGGGAMGCSTAYHLAGDADFGGTIAVIERDPSYERAASALSVGAIRQQFSTPANIALSGWSFDFLQRAGELLEVDGEAPDVGLRRSAFLFLASEAGMEALRSNHEIQLAAGARVALLTAGELADRYAWLDTDGIAAGSLGLEREGWFDGWSLLQALRRKAASLGVDFIEAEITGIERDGGRIAAVTCADGARIACGALVNAAGPWAGDLAALAGVDLPVRPRKRLVHVIDCRAPIANMPMLIDSSGVYVRPEGGQYICGVSPAGADRDCYDFETDDGLFHEVIWPALARRIPAFAEIKLSRVWAGLYDYNTFDQNAILGPHPEYRNLYFINGFSGHGIQQAPAAGRVTADWILHGEPRALDVAVFAWDRIPAGQPVKEVNVI